MGKVALNALKKDDGFSIVGCLDRGDALASCIQETMADVVLDLTVASCALENTQIIIEAGARPVIGTSGLRQEDIDKLAERCAQLERGGLIIPNFSLAAVLMMQFAQQAAPHFEYCDIIEMHHEQKHDAPSGTALRSAELIAAQNPKFVSAQNNETLAHARGANYKNIGIHSLRLRGVQAQQQIIFGKAGETFKISHDTINRECYAPGILLACKEVMKLNKMQCGLETVMPGLHLRN